MLAGPTTSKAAPLYVVKGLLVEVLNCPTHALNAACGDSKIMQRMACHVARTDELDVKRVELNKVILLFVSLKSVCTSNANNHDFGQFPSVL